jgi:pilus assembly protein CpaF
MNSPSTTLEVERDGGKPRIFRFTSNGITIGFSPRCDVSLEPHAPSGPDVEVVIGRDGCMIRTRSDPGTFSLNGGPCAAEAPLKPGDVLSIGKYRITFQAGGPPPKATVQAAKDAPKPPSPKAGLSYLYLFFAPVAEFLSDDDVAEIMINGPAQIYIERKGRLVAVPARFPSEQSLQAAVMNVARSVGRFFDKDNPRLDARLPDGSRVHAVMPPLCRAGTVVAIRKFRREKLTIPQLIDFGSISPETARLLDVIVKHGRNLIVSGATSSGKTSVLNVLSGLIPENDRILVMEDASELQLQQTHKVCFETRKADEYGKGEITIRDLLHSALRLRPDRIVVGEIRGGEALDLLQAMNTGHEGSMSTIHANSARDSLFRMETCALLSGIDIPLSALREQVASAIQVVIQTARLHDGTRKITSVTEVLGLTDHEYALKDIIVFREEGTGPDGRILGRHVFTGYKPTFLDAARKRGFDLAGLFE